MHEFFGLRDVKATRKEHHCEQCGHSIPAGSACHYAAGKAEGDMHYYYEHNECRAAWVALRELRGLYWDEDLEFLNDADIEAGEREWLREAHPVVASRLFDGRD